MMPHTPIHKMQPCTIDSGEISIMQFLTSKPLPHLQHFSGLAVVRAVHGPGAQALDLKGCQAVAASVLDALHVGEREAHNS